MPMHSALQMLPIGALVDKEHRTVQMDTAALVMFRVSTQQALASGGAPANNQSKGKSPVAKSEVPVMEKQQSRTRSWLPSQRRKESTGASSSILRSKSLRRMSSVPAVPSVPSAAAPPLPSPPLPSPSSGSSRGSYESDQVSNFSKTHSVSSSNATTVDGSPVMRSEGKISPIRRPQRPLRPDEHLFGCAIVDDYDADIERVSEDGQGIMRPFSPFAESLSGDVRRFSYLEDPHLANMRVTTPEVHQLMRGTDLAYEALGAALAQTSYGPVTSDTFAPSPLVPGRRPSQRTTSDASEAAFPRKASTASSSKTSQRSKRSNKTVDEMDSRQQARTSRWTLSENMADMFKAQRIKTDKKKMTPSRIEAIWNGEDNAKAAAKRKEKKKRKKAASDSASQAVGTGAAKDSDSLRRETLHLEPFHRPDSISSQIPMRLDTIRQRSIPFEIAIPPPQSAILVSEEIVHDDSSLHRSPSSRSEAKKEVDEEAVIDDDYISEHSIILTPPPKNPARFTARAPTMPQLPPIPESFRATPDNIQLQPQSGKAHNRSRSLNQAIETQDGCFHFNSTPFTLTNPSFRHGPIIFQKSDLGRDSLTIEPEEDNMDWAAFQMAMVGNLDNDLDEFFPQEREDDGNIADEVAAWFEEFGFETHGELRTSEQAKQKNGKRSEKRDSSGSLTSASSSPSTVHTDSDGELRTPVGSSEKHHHVFDTIKMLRTRCESTYSASIYTIDDVNAHWALDDEGDQVGIDQTAATTMDAKQNTGLGLEGFRGCRLDNLY